MCLLVCSIKIEKGFAKRGRRSLLGGPGLAGSWRNPSSSLVGFKRLAGMGKPAVAKRRETLAGQSFGGDSVTWGTSTVAPGHTSRGGAV